MHVIYFIFQYEYKKNLISSLVKLDIKAETSIAKLLNFDVIFLFFI